MSASLTSNYSDEDDGPLNDINVTPLVDVTLVLLIVFMITVPAIVGSAPVRVDLPQTTAVAAASEQLPLVFTLKRGESGAPVLYLNENQTDEARLRQLFKDRGAPNEERASILIRRSRHTVWRSDPSNRPIGIAGLAQAIARHAAR